MENIKWKLKKKYKTVDTSDLYYDLFDGGYIDPKKFLEDEEQIKKVNDAIKLIESYLEFLKDEGAVEVV